MANFTKDTTWVDTAIQTKIDASYTLSTAKKYVDRDINLEINVPGMVLENGQAFYITDTLNTWNWSIDDDGNVLIY